uniref:hypothetical protein n=1 Tax=Verminephrobacter eiseniae TaxID=364317 RepID=UPI002238FD3D|nr:hypothetical protein [Verminephrobacter eiseniae]
MTKRPTCLDYYQYLLMSPPVNYTLTNFAEHMDSISHDAISRFLREEKTEHKDLPFLQVPMDRGTPRRT